MKKVILAAIAVMAFGFANAQNTKFGIKGGIQLSSLIGNIENETPKLGLQLGGFAEFRIAKGLFIQPEILYSTQGGKYETSAVDYLYKQELNASYLIFPIMLKYYVVDKVNLEVGPQIGFLLEANGNYKTRNGAEIFYSGNGSTKDIYKTENIGLNIGAGYDFTKNISAGIRYHFGMSNEMRYYPAHNDFEDQKQIRMRNDVVSLSVGYKF